MNRIYQGKITALEMEQSKREFVSTQFGNEADCPIYRHHRIFQDAINYYLLALGALATVDDKTSNPVELNLRLRLAEAWAAFPHSNLQGARSLRDSVCHWLGLGPEATMDEAMAVILAENDACSELRSLAFRAFLSTILADKESPSVDGKVRNASKNLELFVLKQHAKNYPFESKVAEQAAAKKLKAIWIHSLDPHELASRLQFHHYAKINPSNGLRNPKATKERLIAAVTGVVDDIQQKLRLLNLINELAEEFVIPNESPGTIKGEGFRRKFDAFLIFKYVVADEFTHTLLREYEERPSEKMLSSNRQATTSKSQEFSWEGQDPIQAARSSVGYVFRAFTSLSSWNGEGPGTWRWKGFEIAAFAEALKSLNQFNQKTEERQKDRMKLLKQKAYILEVPGVTWEDARENEDQRAPLQLGTDARYPLLKNLEYELSETLNEGDWKITRSAIRGLTEIIEKWQREKNPTEDSLTKIVKDFQRDEKNQRDIGSLPLFLALCQKPYWPVWQQEQSDDEEHDEKPISIFRAVADFHELERDIERKQQPIKLTPAEAKHSRRLYMFSDLSGRSAPKFVGNSVEVSLAYRTEAGVSEKRAKLTFSAPRLGRDSLLGGEHANWLQPMIKALGFSDPSETKAFHSAVSLMPDFDRKNQLRLLLNFPVTLDPSWIHAEIGRTHFWKNQFNGTREENLHLHWPDTASEAALRSPWWTQPAIIANGFTILANDLGQRTAGAWSLITVTTQKPIGPKKWRYLGEAGGHSWYATFTNQGMHRLPGEDVKVLENGKWVTEKSGSKGRMATKEEHAEAMYLAQQLGALEPENWLGKGECDKSYSEQNDALIKIANRRLTRLATYHRWTCFSPDKLEDSNRLAKQIGAIKTEFDGYVDSDVVALKSNIEACDWESFRAAATILLQNLQNQIESILVQIANRTVPLRKKQVWQWRPNGGNSPYGQLVFVDADVNHSPPTRGQRGLSMNRIEQLDGLRKLFLRFNRAMDKKPGIPASFGYADRGRESGEPCPQLLEKIDAMKEQRVNQTAHLILAQALGLRLKASSLSPKEREKNDIHGEYEKIPHRKPVDFIVIEDLSRYTSSQGRAPSENSRLMKWAHRAVRDKIKMLSEEPFGIPVVEVQPAYSSRFHAATGVAGARGFELTELATYQRESLQKLADAKKNTSAAAQQLLDQFDELATINQSLPPHKRHTLFYPRAGGPMFLAANGDRPTQADLNAASNLGLRAIASPQVLDIHNKIRTEKKKDSFFAVKNNKREKAAFKDDNSIIIAPGEMSKELSKSTNPNFFYDAALIGDYDRATWQGHPLTSGVSLWSSVNLKVLESAVKLNRKRLDATDPIPM